MYDNCAVHSLPQIVAMKEVILVGSIRSFQLEPDRLFYNKIRVNKSSLSKPPYTEW
jgi:hypothetical protein